MERTAMRFLSLSCVLGLSLWLASNVSAQDPVRPELSPNVDLLQLMAGDKVKPGEAKGGNKVQAGEAKGGDKLAGKEQAPQPARPEADEFASAPAPGGEAPVGLNPNMIGDFPGYFGLQKILFPVTQVVTTFQNVQMGTRQGFIIVDGVKVPVQVPNIVRVPVTTQSTVNVPIVTSVLLGFGGGNFKVAENQTPMPTDRGYLTYNYYNGVRGPGSSSDTPQFTSQSTIVNGVPATVTSVGPGGPPAIDLHRQTFGFEKTFLDGYASIGMRLPFAQVQGDGSLGQQDIGDMSWLFNYALYRDTATGSVLSAGIMATLPTGPPVYTLAGNIHPALVQPFFGYRWATDRFYVQGFTSSAFPTDSRFVTGMFNDIAVGYWLYRDRSRDAFISAVIPTLETHVTTPLNHRGANSLITVPDIVALTGGVHIGFANRAILTIGVTVPVTGPQVFPVEAVAQFNFRF
jgi:hypothetical protein